MKKKKIVKEEPLLKAREVACMADDLSPDDVLVACRKGLLACVRVGKAGKFCRIPLGAAKKFIEQRRAS